MKNDQRRKHHVSGRRKKLELTPPPSPPAAIYLGCIFEVLRPHGGKLGLESKNIASGTGFYAAPAFVRGSATSKASAFSVSSSGQAADFAASDTASSRRARKSAHEKGTRLGLTRNQTPPHFAPLGKYIYCLLFFPLLFGVSARRLGRFPGLAACGGWVGQG